MATDTFIPFPEPSEPTDAFGVDRGWREVRRYPPGQPDDSDIVEAVIYVSRMPAEFYKVESEALLAPLTTGSGSEMARLADSIAQAIVSGMLGQNQFVTGYAGPDREVSQ
jgi:hypothetical protein